MTAQEYFTFERSRIANQAHERDRHTEKQCQSEMLVVNQQEAERKSLITTLRPGHHWVTIHWLVPYGAGVRAHSIAGTVKSVTRDNVDIWVKSRPEAAETKIHGISQGDIVSVPLECVTSVTEPMEDLYPEGEFPSEL